MNTNNVFRKISDHNSPILVEVRLNYFARSFTTTSGELFSRVQDGISGAMLNISQAEVDEFGLKVGDIVHGEYNQRSGYFSVIEKVTDTNVKAKSL